MSTVTFGIAATEDRWNSVGKADNHDPGMTPDRKSEDVTEADIAREED